MRRESIIPLIAGILLIALVSFSAGFLWNFYKMPPSNKFGTLQDFVKRYQQLGFWTREGLYVQFDVSASDPDFKVVRPEALMPGYRLIMGYDIDLDTYSVRLYDTAGEVRHTWPLSYSALAGKPGAEELNTHGMVAYPNGDLVVNFGDEADLMARIDVCGKPKWVEHGAYHHSIDIDDDGLLWTWFSPDNQNAQRQYMVALDPDTGETVKSIALEDIAAKSIDNLTNLTLPVGFKFHKGFRGQQDDLFHPNDVEPLRAEMADEYPMFEAGDLLVSFRHLSLIAVIDPDTLEFKWVGYGPWRQQHDPDFIGGGKISLYDNALFRNRSNILIVDPETGKIDTVFTTDESNYYSPAQGKQQMLPDGSFLIVVPAEGRVLEISGDGELILDYNNIKTDGVNARVLNADWVPEDFFTTFPSCDTAPAAG